MNEFATKLKKNNDPEEFFLTLLQRIQRHYATETPQSATTTTTAAANNNNNTAASNIELPPDEAAAAMGKQLALAFQTMVEENINKGRSKNSNKSSQEKVLNGLSNRRVNPAVMETFFQTLLSLSSTRVVTMEWLPLWILHCDLVCLEDMHGHHDDAPSFDALTATIRAFANYMQIKVSTTSALAVVVASGGQNNAGSITTNNTNNNTTTSAKTTNATTAAAAANAKRTTNTNGADASIENTFQKLSTSWSRTCMIREFTKVAFKNLDYLRNLLSPIMACSVLALSTPLHEGMFFLEGIWRECWAEMGRIAEEKSKTSFETMFGVLTWMTTSLDFFLWSISCRPTLELRLASKELSFRWLVQLLEMGSFLAQSMEDSPGGTKAMMVSQWLDKIMGETVLTMYASSSTYRIPLDSALAQVHGILERIHGSKFRIDPMTTMRLAILAMSNPIKEDVSSLLRLLAMSLPAPSNSNLYVQGSIRAVASMFLRDETCSNNAKQVLKTLHAAKTMEQSIMRSSVMSKSITNALQFLDEAIVDVADFVNFLLRNDTFQGCYLSAIQQNGALLLGMGLFEDPKNREAAYTYLKHLVSHFPHLGISLLPIFIDSINNASIRGDGKTLIRQLEFLCDAIVLDKQCAREIWNLLGVEMMKPTTPSVIRATVIRLFPKLCATNRRLYKRAIEALGANLAITENAEIRLAVAATLADFAKGDQIRDVSDVIGWIQGFVVDSGWIRRASTLDDALAPRNTSLVHYAVLTLHYLVVAQELDFDLVLAVLNKRLCNVHEINEVLKLPLLVLESLILLLGDGECDDSSDKDEEGKTNIKRLSGKVEKSVETLIKLANSKELKPGGNNRDDSQQSALFRCRKNIYKSLSKYSLEALGLDEEGVQTVVTNADSNEQLPLPPSGERYIALKQMIADDFRNLGRETIETQDATSLETTPEGKDSDEKSALVTFSSRLLKFEEDILGSTIWHKRSNQRKIQKQGNKRNFPLETAQFEALPSSANVQNVYNENRSTVTSLAVLLCFDGKPLSLLTDLASDIANEYPDPLTRAFTVQAWLNAARQLLAQFPTNDTQGLEQILHDIREWRFRFEHPDNMYFLLAALALYIPEAMRDVADCSAHVQEISNEIYDAYAEHEFESSDAGKLCLGMIGVSAAKTKSSGRLRSIVEILEASVSGYGGQVSFGAYYSLAMIAQAIPVVSKDQLGTDDQRFVGQIIGYLVNEMIGCTVGRHSTLDDLVVCIKTGRMGPKIVDSLATLRKKSLQLVESKRQAAKGLFISFALCLPALASINDELLLGVYCLLESYEWGTGKGIALPSVLRACRQCGLLDNREIERIYSRYAAVFEEGMNESFSGLDDIFYAVTATMTQTMPYSIRRFLVGNRALFDEDGRALSVLAAVVSLSSLPCLGRGAELFTETPELSDVASKDDVQGVVDLVSEGAASREWNKYSQVSSILMGYMASLNSAIENTNKAGANQPSDPPETESEKKLSQLPTAQPGTILELVMSILTQRYDEQGGLDAGAIENEVVELLGCLEVLSLPGHFATFLEQLFHGTEEVKAASARLLVSQLRGRPRAVFDGRDYVSLALQISTTSISALRKLLGQGKPPLIFIESLVHTVPKLPSDSVEEAVENVWHLCINQVGHNPSWTISFLSAMKTLLMSVSNKKSPTMSPKTLNFVRLFVLRRIFSGIRDTPWAVNSTSSSQEERSIIELYVQCLMEMPITSLMEADFFSLKELDGFVGEALRNRCVMIMVRLGYFTTPSRASSEIAGSIAWFSRQLISCEEEIFSSTLLQVACTIAEATSVETPDRKKELLLTLLENLLLTAASASYVGLQMLSALLARWCNGSRSDGDVSLACLCVAGMGKWHALSPSTLQQMVRLLIHDLPFNLAEYCRQEKISGVVFNRLWRIYNNWWEHGADQETIDCVRKALLCCRRVENGEEEFASLVTSMLQS